MRLAIELRHDFCTESASTMITTLRLGSPSRFVPNLQSNSATGMLSSSSFCRLCLSIRTFGTHTDFAPRSARTVCHLVCSRLVAFCSFFLAAGWSRSFVLLGLHGALSLVSFCRLAQCSFQLMVVDHWLHVLFTRVLACFRVQDEGTVHMDIVEAFSFVQHFRSDLDCCSVSDDLFPAVRLEDYHFSSVCTLPLDRQDLSRCSSPKLTSIQL